MRRPRHALILLILALAAASGCATAPPKQTPAMKALGQTELSKRELQMLIHQYGYHYAGQVELVTSDIVAQTNDRAIRSSAIIWNTIGVPEMMRSCFNNDPMVGLILAWIYAAQVREYLDTGYGRTAFGPYQSRVVEVSRSSGNSRPVGQATAYAWLPSSFWVLPSGASSGMELVIARPIRSCAAATNG